MLISTAQKTITITDQPALLRKINLVNLNSPEKYHNHRSASAFAQNKLSYSQLVTRAYQDRHLWGPGLFILKKLSSFQA